MDGFIRFMFHTLNPVDSLKYTEAMLRRWINPTDKQNVDGCVRFFNALSLAVQKCRTKGLQQEVSIVFKVISAVGDCLIALILGKTTAVEAPALKKILQLLSKAAHLLFACFLQAKKRSSRGSFIPNQLYNDIQVGH